MIRIKPVFIIDGDIATNIQDKISKTVYDYLEEAKTIVGNTMPQDTTTAYKNLYVKHRQYGGEVGIRKRYIRFPEYGTAHQAPQKFFWTSLAKAKARYRLRDIKIDD